MTRFLLSVAILAVFGSTVRGSDPAFLRPAAKPKPGRVVSNPYLQALASAVARDQETFRDMLELLTKPQPCVAEFLLRRCNDDPSFRMNRLLNESEDFGQIRVQLRRFWMNNQPSVLTYERLKGAIGP